MTIYEAIKFKLQWRKDNYPPPLADEINADNLSIEALEFVASWNEKQLPQHQIRLSGETKE